MKKAALICICMIAVGMPTLAFASAEVGTVDSTYKYAWGENAGWINFAPTGAGLVITDSAVTGHAWSHALGWINFSPMSSEQGVANTCEGVLSGSAWSTTLGWIDMTGVVIDEFGVFTGIANDDSSPAGRVNFDCQNCEVRTDWRQCDLRDDAPSGPGNSGGGGGGGGGGGSNDDEGDGEQAPTVTADSPGGSCPDIVPDGRMDVLDFNSLVVNWGSTDPGNPADTNGDSRVDIFDFNQVMICWTR